MSRAGWGPWRTGSRRPESCPHQVSAETEAMICEMRREHPKWGPVRLAFELGKAGVIPVPSRMSAYRVLVRHGLVEPEARKRPKNSYRRWEPQSRCPACTLPLTSGTYVRFREI
jgi:hypothetical protein